jgi:hydroxymethylbilane synthase
VTPLKIGTRRSALAIAQANEVLELLAAQGIPAELVPMSTAGDEGADVGSSQAGLKGLFVDALVDSLIDGSIDLAVHSAKDLPVEDEDELAIAAVPERRDPSDVLVMSTQALPKGAVIGTSSLRRRAQLIRAFPGVKVADIRGNVDTRLRKMAEGEVDAVCLAAAGLVRLGLVPDHVRPLTLAEMIPAPGQGCLAVQARVDDEAARGAVSSLDHAPSRVALEAERSLMWRLGGGCDLPLGALATVEEDVVRMVAVIATPDGSHEVRAGGEAAYPEGAAAVTARALIDGGAEAILEALV